MGCQRAQGAPRRVRLTDQALVAVGLARSTAEALARPATAAHLVLGLAGEAEGVAGHLLREQSAAVLGLHARLPSLPPDLATLEEVVAVASRWIRRPPGTGELLVAAVEHGGRDLPELLAAAGFQLDQLRDHADGLWDRDPASPTWAPAEDRSPRAWLYLWLEGRWGPASETFGLRPQSDPAPDLEFPAALALARTRAVDGGAVELLLALAASGDPDVELAAPPDGWLLATALESLYRRGVPDEAGTTWDRGLDEVVRAARTWRAPDQVGPADLLRAAVVAGGTGPLSFLEAVRRHGESEQSSD